MIKTTHTMLGVALATSFLLAGCGPGSTTTTSKTTASSQTGDTSHTDTQGQDQGPGGVSEQFEKIQACLKEAGLEDKLPQRSKGDSGERPSAPPTGQPPSDADRTAGGPFADEDVQKALKACGIDLPERPGGPGQPR